VKEKEYAIFKEKTYGDYTVGKGDESLWTQTVDKLKNGGVGILGCTKRDNEDWWKRWSPFMGEPDCFLFLREGDKKVGGTIKVFRKTSRFNKTGWGGEWRHFARKLTKERES